MKSYGGGLLIPCRDGINTVQNIICYHRKGGENNELLDDCFSEVVKRLRENYLFVNEDIQKHDLVGKFCSMDIGPWLESRFRYLINMDPTTLSIPCEPDDGNWLPIHYVAAEEVEEKESVLQIFCFMLEAGVKAYPEKFGFVFSNAGQALSYKNESNNETKIGTPYQLACKNYGHEVVTKEMA